MVASNIQNSAAAAAEIEALVVNKWWYLANFKIHISSAAAAEFIILVIKNSNFADWPFPESAAVKLKKSKK